jgi:hypothetical protein
VWLPWEELIEREAWHVDVELRRQFGQEFSGIVTANSKIMEETALRLKFPDWKTRFRRDEFVNTTLDVHEDYIVAHAPPGSDRHQQAR